MAAAAGKASQKAMDSYLRETTYKDYRLDFGIHKGKRLSRVPLVYLRSLAENEWISNKCPVLHSMIVAELEARS